MIEYNGPGWVLVAFTAPVVINFVISTTRQVGERERRTLNAAIKVFGILAVISIVLLVAIVLLRIGPYRHWAMFIACFWVLMWLASFAGKVIGSSLFPDDEHPLRPAPFDGKPIK